MELAAFLALATLALIRLPALKRGGAGTLSALALITGAGALFMVGTVVPLQVVDGWFGGTNVVNLFQNVLATLAIWFMAMTAKRMATGSKLGQRELLELIFVICLFMIPFALMDRGQTHENFVWAYAGDGWLWLYASIYMGYVAYLMACMLVSLRNRKARPYGVVRLGAVLMGTASVAEIIYLSARVLGHSPEWLGDSFIPLFYGGILMFAAGLGWFPLARQARNAALRIAGRLLRHASAEHRIVIDRADSDSDTIAHQTYRLAVQLADFGNTAELTRKEQRSLRFATRLLNLQVPAPQVIRMTADPKVST